LDVEYTLLFQKQYVIAVQKRNGNPTVKNEEIWPVPFVRSRVKIKTISGRSFQVFHATETKNVDMERSLFK